MTDRERGPDLGEADKAQRLPWEAMLITWATASLCSSGNRSNS